MKAVQKTVGARPHHVERGTQNKAPMPLHTVSLRSLGGQVQAHAHSQEQDVECGGMIHSIGIHVPGFALCQNQGRAEATDEVCDEGTPG